MKRFVILAIMALAVVSCKKEKVITAQQGDNQLEEGACLQKVKGQSNVTLCFNELVQDSRCPVNTACFWRGVAVAEFTLKTGGSEAVTFNLADLKAAGYTNDTTINNIHFILKEVTPFPGEPGYNLKKKKVTLEIQ